MKDHCPDSEFRLLNTLIANPSFSSYAASELHRLLQPFLLRRVKAQVATELPKKTEVVIYHGMSALQKKYYKAILMKDLGTGTRLFRSR